MKLLAYEVDKRSFLGVLNEDETWVYPVAAAGMEYRSMKDLIRDRQRWRCWTIFQRRCREM